jgi:NAD(P)-dependent dehydrogenase (short-subunit alcohol dehydrogenase family)
MLGSLAAKSGMDSGDGMLALCERFCGGKKIEEAEILLRCNTVDLASGKKARISAYACDVADEEAARETLARIEKDAGAVDILVNNTGIIKRTLLIETITAGFRAVADAGFTTAFITAKTIISDVIPLARSKRAVARSSLFVA